MGSALTFAVPRGGGHLDIWVVFCGGASVSVSLWIGVVGFHTPHPAGARELP